MSAAALETCWRVFKRKQTKFCMALMTATQYLTYSATYDEIDARVHTLYGMDPEITSSEKIVRSGSVLSPFEQWQGLAPRQGSTNLQVLTA